MRHFLIITNTFHSYYMFYSYVHAINVVLVQGARVRRKFLHVRVVIIRFYACNRHLPYYRANLKLLYVVRPVVAVR